MRERRERGCTSELSATSQTPPDGVLSCGPAAPRTRVTCTRTAGSARRCPSDTLRYGGTLPRPRGSRAGRLAGGCLSCCVKHLTQETREGPVSPLSSCRARRRQCESRTHPQQEDLLLSYTAALEGPGVPQGPLQTPPYLVTSCHLAFLP